jgi:hypothetical protein
VTQPVYEKIEFCRSPKTLWGKLRSKRWDWLGVHPEGQFVLGYPRRRVPSSRAAGTVRHQGAREGEHGVRVDSPFGHAGTDWFPTEAEAVAFFEGKLSEGEESSEGPELLKVSRIEGRVPVEEEYVVRKPPTYVRRGSR